MADPKDKSEDEGTIVEKEELVEFLTSSSKIRRGLAESIYDQGLNTWELLADGDEEYFTSFKGVGKKTSEELIILGDQKKEELSSAPEPAREIREVLSEVPRVYQSVIDSLIDAGFDDVYKVSAVDPSELREVQGVGPKLSEKIVEACREEAEEHPQSVAGVEEAMSLPADEEAPAEKGEGFLSKLIGKIKGFFSTEKDTPSTPEAPVEETTEDEGEKEPEEVPSEEEPSEDEKESEETAEEKPSEEGEASDEEPAAEDKVEEEEPSEEGETSDEEPAAEDDNETVVSSNLQDSDLEDELEPSEEDKDEPVEEPSEDEKEPSDEEPEEPPKEEPRSLWGKIKGIFSKKEEEAPSEEKEPSEEEPAAEDEPEPTEEEGETPSDDKDEESPENEGEKEPSEEGEEPSEEAPSEKEPVKEEPSEEKASEEEPRLEIKDIHHIPGVDKKTADLLLSSGYMNLDELREAVPEDLMMIEGIDEDVAKFIYEVLRK